MLSPDDRALYAECLEAPEDYRFDHGVATTFTLDLEALLLLPFTLATRHSEDRDALLLDPVALLESLRATSDRLTVFHHAGYIKVPNKAHALFGLLEDSVVPTTPTTNGGIFHPKVWLLRFVHVDDESPMLRAVVLSRNLTFARTWDTVLCFDGWPTGNRVRDSYGLRDLIAALPDLARTDLSDERRRLIAELTDEIGRTRFEAPQPFHEAVRFHALGLGAKFEPAVEGHGKRMLCISPFLTGDAIARAKQLADTKHILVSRPFALDMVGKAAVADWDCRVLTDAVETGDTADDEPPTGELSRHAPMRGLHAKAVAVEDHQRRVTWWIGSANLTGPAWDGGNVELMVELRGTAKHAGIDRFLESGFDKLLEPWTPGDGDPEEAAHEAAVHLAEEARRELVAAGLRLRCEGEGDAWHLTLEGVPDLPTDVAGSAWPISLNQGPYGRALAPTLEWAPVSVVSLSSIVAFELTGTYQGVDGSIRFALQLPHEGFPEDRHAHIVRHIVSTRAGFLRYLRLLLAATSGELSVLGLDALTDAAEPVDNSTGRSGVFDDVLLEELVRTLSREPSRLDAIDRLIADLSKTEAGRGLIPPELLTLWSTIREVRGQT